MARTTIRRVSRKKPTKKAVFFQKLKPVVAVVVVLLVVFAVGFHYRNGLAYYLGFKSKFSNQSASEQKRISDVRNYTLLSKYESNPAGIDVSEYQGTILWDSVHLVENEFPIQFVFVRATAGVDYVDKKFAENWVATKKMGLIRGAYHYYRPDENSKLQADLFIKNVALRKGDFPPVLDIEQMPKRQSMAELKKGIRNWLERVEQHYGVQPILYSGERFYTDFLKEDFSEYTCWIANYNFFVENLKPHWQFWQFTEKGSVYGISGFVDVNIFNGTEDELVQLTLGN